MRSASDIIGYLDGERYRYMVIKSIKVDRFILQDININIRNAKTEQEREVNSMLSKKHIINSSYNPFVNVLKAKQFNISPTGIVTKKKTADINFWKNRK